MSRDEHIEMVARYFAAVDKENLDRILALLTPDCVFGVETHSVRLHGHEEITGMFRRLWANHAAVRHYNFHYVSDQSNGRVSVQFQVENTERDGSVTRKSNCNFFDVAGAQFSRVAVYMAGANTLESGAV